MLEDNPYGLLYFDEPAPNALRSLDEEGVIYLGSFSKTLAPGFRVGWALAPHAIREKLILAAESAILSPSSFSQLVVSEYLATADWRAQIDTFRGVYRERKDAMIEALGEYLPQLNWTNPNGGFYVWVTLPDVLDSKADAAPRGEGARGVHARHRILRRRPRSAREHAPVVLLPDARARSALGIRRLATVINGELDLLDTFAGTGPLQLPPSAGYDSAPPSDLK